MDGGAGSQPGGEASGDRALLCRALADDLELLALLHDREPTAAVIEALKRCPFEQQLALRLESEASKAALAAFAEALSDVPTPLSAADLDVLAAGFADVYLRYAYRAAPTESVWMTEDGLDRQGPMLDIRAELQRYGVRLADWNNRSEDHLVPQLRFVARLLNDAAAASQSPEPAVRFLDRHVLRWSHAFAKQLVRASAPPFYAALAVLTACILDEQRDRLAAITGIARPAPELLPSEQKARKPGPEDERYVPGVAPSW